VRVPLHDVHISHSGSRPIPCRSSNFDRRVLAPAYMAAGWRYTEGNGQWTWHSLRHVLCTTALFTWKLDATDVSAMAGHANVRTTLDMYINSRVLHQAGEKPQVSSSRSGRNSVRRLWVTAV
jgi:integrase